jgi:heme A synthase
VTFRDLHVGWAWVMILSNALAGVWSLAAHRVESLRTRALWWFTVVAEVAILVQVLLGIATMKVDDIEPVQFHMFYGFVALFTVAILYAYRSQLQHRLYLLYGFGGLFLMGLGIRAVLVGS